MYIKFGVYDHSFQEVISYKIRNVNDIENIAKFGK